MSDHTKIEWTDATWNPVRGCVKISPGCAHCYAETFAERFRGVKDHPYHRGFDPRIVPGKLTDPFRWTTSKSVFVNSMSDLFQEAIPDDYIAEVASVMAAANWHVYQVLTKRSSRMCDMLNGRLDQFARLPHIWWGVSVENRKDGFPRIEHLRRAPADIRFLSIEPLLEDLGEVDLSCIDWVILGGESGARARPLREEWVQSVHTQCEAAGIPFFFKQWGGVRKHKTGRSMDGRTFDDRPKMVHAACPDRRGRQSALDEWVARARAREGGM